MQKSADKTDDFESLNNFGTKKRVFWTESVSEMTEAKKKQKCLICLQHSQTIANNKMIWQIQISFHA